jgi:hypothetical protein
VNAQSVKRMLAMRRPKLNRYQGSVVAWEVGVTAASPCDAGAASARWAAQGEHWVRENSLRSYRLRPVERLVNRGVWLGGKDMPRDRWVAPGGAVQLPNDGRSGTLEIGGTTSKVVPSRSGRPETCPLLAGSCEEAMHIRRASTCGMDTHDVRQIGTKWDVFTML